MDPKDYNQAQIDSGKLSIDKITELVHEWQRTHDLVVDGIAGPVTVSSIDAVLIPETPPLKWEPWDGPLERQPRNRREVYQMFGNPGVGTPDKRWERENITTVRDMPGVPSKWYFRCHRLVEPYMREAFRRAQIAAPQYQIERAASYVFRHQRHDPKRPLSYHSLGIAVDIDPHRNFGKSFKKGQTPEAWSSEYWAIWSEGLPRAFVEAFQSCGFASGIDWDEDGYSSDHTFIDPMHLVWLDRSGRGMSTDV